MHATLSVEAAVGLDGPGAWTIRAQAWTLLLLAGLTVTLVRAELLGAGPWRAILYPFGLFGTTFASYFVLRGLLPGLHPVLLDARLTAIDIWLFGQTPAVWLDRWVNRATVEWFAFFYYSYFPLGIAYLIGSLVYDGGQRRDEMLLSAALIFAVGHCTYPFVPGAGPHVFPGLSFVHPLIGGVFWQRIDAIVGAAGANLDIFPSLHTALSVLVALHAVRHRRAGVLRWAWLPTCVMSSQIVISTVFLRWHYGVDVLAGAVLAFFAQRVAIIACARRASRPLRSRQPAWEPVLPLDMDPDDRRWVLGVFSIPVAALAYGFVHSLH